MKYFGKSVTSIHSAARELFWKHGFRRVTVEEICRKAQISKMTFYRYYANKLELAKAVFNQVVEEGMDKFRRVMKESTSPEEKIKKILLLKYEGTHEISDEFLRDFYTSREPELRQFVSEKTEAVWQEILHVFRQAQAEGIFRKDFHPEIILSLSQRMPEIINDPGISRLYNTPQDFIMELTGLIIYGIVPR